MQRKGLFISIEGPPEAGKSTLLRRLEKRLKASVTVPVVTTRDGAGTAVADSLQRLFIKRAAEIEPVSLLFLEAAARMEQVTRIIRPGLLDGSVIVSDTFADNGYALHSASGNDTAGIRPVFEMLNTFSVGDAMPDITILLDADPETVQERSKALRFTANQAVHYQRTRDALLLLADRAPSRFRTVDASATPAQVEAQAWVSVEAALNRRGIPYKPNE